MRAACGHPGMIIGSLGTRRDLRPQIGAVRVAALLVGWIV